MYFFTMLIKLDKWNWNIRVDTSIICRIGIISAMKYCKYSLLDWWSISISNSMMQSMQIERMQSNLLSFFPKFHLNFYLKKSLFTNNSIIFSITLRSGLINAKIRNLICQILSLKSVNRSQMLKSNRFLICISNLFKNNLHKIKCSK
jgi:hypothetical protein